MKRNGEWVFWTYGEYEEAVRATAKGLLALGLESKRGVGIMGLFTPEMMFSVFGAIFAGGLSCGKVFTRVGRRIKVVLKS